MTLTPITTDLTVLNQSINIDVESIAPLSDFGPNAYDVANMTITATIQSPQEKDYRLVLAADTESGTSASVRVVSGTDSQFKKLTANFKRITKKDAEIILPILAKVGVTLDPSQSEKKQLEAHAAGYKIADLTIPQGQHVIRIHASQKLLPSPANAKQFQFVMYAPQLSLAPVSNVRLGATLVFPMDFQAAIDAPVVAPMPGQPAVNLVAGGDTPVQLGSQRAYGWAFQADPMITIGYTYP